MQNSKNAYVLFQIYFGMNKLLKTSRLDMGKAMYGIVAVTYLINTILFAMQLFC